MYDYRRQLGEERPDENKNKLNAEASYSEQGNKLAVFDAILGDMKMTPAYEEFAEQLDGQETSEEEKMAQASSLLNEAKPYLRTEEGKQHELLLRQQQIETMKNFYKGKK